MSVVAQNISLQVEGEDWLYPFDLTLETGSFTTLIGATRAGKTSLLRVLAGLARPTTGALIVDGVDVTGVNVRKRSVGMVYQEFVNYPGKTVFENIAAPLRNAKEPADTIKKRVGEVAEIVGITPLLDRFPLELSGGQQQRVAIARTIARKRRLVLLDEPLVNLDYKLREHLRGEFSRIFSESETIAVYASSEPHEALILNGDVLVLTEGRVTQQGRAADVYTLPESVSVARQISDPPMSIIPARLVKSGAARLWTAAGTEIGAELAQTESLPDGDYQLGVYPHQLSTDQTRPGLDTVVDFVEVSGSNSFIYTRLGDHMLAVKEKGIHDHAIGDTVQINFDLAHALVFDTKGGLVAGPAGGKANG
ncbi:ABC transporter ATP-binding protein [Cognatishimia maritima]|uniref:Glycerol transport system ATP-binding protein n=1 Tax=Cognatishimia maritima TaxID=870908 RepID=A0A1M5VLL7_9RHOB|nr:ABC transporter ATP-binding protein [Cognatishimia maritima]SHH75803.1 glycerol transport system ATP-binding protein [Cognatishimia maritima]